MIRARSSSPSSLLCLRPVSLEGRSLTVSGIERSLLRVTTRSQGGGSACRSPATVRPPASHCSVYVCGLSGGILPRNDPAEDKRWAANLRQSPTVDAARSTPHMASRILPLCVNTCSPGELRCTKCRVTTLLFIGPLGGLGKGLERTVLSRGLSRL